MKTKLIVTLGPSTFHKIEALIQKGVDIFRLNCSHGNHALFEELITQIHGASKKLNKKCAILLDIAGVKIRVEGIEEPLDLKRGAYLRIAKEPQKGAITLTYPQILDEVRVGEYIFFADGSIRGKIVQKEQGSILVEILNSGVLSNKKGVNLPHSHLHLPAITKKDEEDLRFGAKMGVDLIAISFVSQAEDIQKARAILQEENSDAWIIAKIERAQGVKNLSSILAQSDGIMVARGDLGIEVGIHKVPVIQKRIIKKANIAKKPVITATQMLLSMVRSPFPTRAEVSDIANAILDGSDALMLSDETAVGAYPMKAVNILKKSAKEAECIYPYFKRFDTKSEDAIALSVADLAQTLDPYAILAFTTKGTTVRSIAKYRPKTPIFAITHSEETARKLSLVWGVERIFLFPLQQDANALLHTFLAQTSFPKGSKAIVTMGSLVGKEGSTNMIRIVEF